MATQVKRAHVYGNFKPKRADRKKENTKTYKDRDGMSEAHAKCIRLLPCCITLRVPGGEIHHLKQGTGERGMGLRATDKHGVPMSHEAHMEVEAAGTRNERKWFMERGIDPLELAADLWNATGNLAQMTQIVIAHHRGTP